MNKAISLKNIRGSSIFSLINIMEEVVYRARPVRTLIIKASRTAGQVIIYFDSISDFILIVQPKVLLNKLPNI